MKESFLQYGDYKARLPEWQEGSKFEPNVESDERCKKFLVNSVNNDDILRKLLMLGFIKDGIIDKNVGQLYIIKKLVQG